MKQQKRIMMLVFAALTMTLFACKVKIFHKIIIHICLFSSFIFSAYISGAHQFNNQSDNLKAFQNLSIKNKELNHAVALLEYLHCIIKK